MIGTCLALSDVISTGDTVMTLCEYLDGSDALSLSRVCTKIYQTLSRNTPMGISIWRRYLSDARYQANKLTFEVGLNITKSGAVSRANYKLILAVLVQKNGFIKISRLRDLAAKGKLGVPILPHKGLWRDLIRIDPFALKRASKEAPGGSSENSPPTNTGPSTEAFICELAGQKSKQSVLEEYVDKYYLLGDPVAQLECLVRLCLTSGNISGLSDILFLSMSRVDGPGFQGVVSACILPFRTALENNIFHEIVRDGKLVVSEKSRVILQFLQVPGLPCLLNQVNLLHETPLVLAMKRDRVGLSRVCSEMVARGADAGICDKHGVFYTD